MPDIVFVHVLEPEHPGGGADVRARALASEVGKQLSTELLVVGPGQEIVAQPRFLTRLGAAVRGVPPRFSQRYDRRVQHQVQQRVRGAKVVVAETLFALPYVLGINAKVVLDAHNVETEVVSRLARRHPSWTRRLAYAASEPWSRHWEETASGRVSQVWAVSEQEARWFTRQAHDVVVVPNGVYVPAAPMPLASSASLLFVGSLRAQFNRDGLRWFLKNCWPRIHSTEQDAVLHLAGAGSEDFAGEGVVAHGFVDDLTPLYRQARLAVVPLLDGAGTRLKALEAMAYGKPTVSTTIGVEGLVAEPDSAVVIADSVSAFADACTDLLSDDARARRVGVAAHTAAKDYDWSVIGRRATGDLVRLI